MQQNEQVYKCADPARQKVHWFQKKKTKRTYNNDSYWTESEYKRMVFFYKKISFEPVGKMD